MGTEDAFERVVSEVYKYWRESAATDVRILVNLGRSRPGVRRARAFGDLIRDLRTAAQHDDNPRAVKVRGKWLADARSGGSVGDGSEWSRCARALLSELVEALRALREVAEWIEASPELVGRWREEVRLAEETDPEALTREIAGDLSLRFPSGTERHIARQAKYQLDRVAATQADDRAGYARRVAAREVVAVAMPVLPCDHVEVLERLGAWGSDALQALLVAHAVAAFGGYADQEDFLDAVERAWLALETEMES
ncbi:hypothetical protein [Cellulomonas hominis]|uniref:hypothetical protein n=1 Tax=Cellulomonas hominis TaxID=156981 RepID=UPI00144471C3|nr:hypothetical protein [Cellulomonas hominis]NKY08905.1 hypothetical protein [Cellulomonas hominis]